MKKLLIIVCSVFVAILLLNYFYYKSLYSKQINYIVALLLNKVTLRPWGAKEFAISDMQLGIRFQQW
jgi:hypothetical protein